MSIIVKRIRVVLYFGGAIRLFFLLTREISWSTLKINVIFPHIHVLFSILLLLLLLLLLSLTDIT